jgi:hypothetical protein
VPFHVCSQSCSPSARENWTYRFHDNLTGVGGEVGQVLIIGNDLDNMWYAFKEGAPFLEDMDICEKFFVIDLIINLSWGMLS